MRSTILFKYSIVSNFFLNKNIIHTFQIFKSFQDSSQIHSSRTILIAAFQRHFISKDSTEVRQLPTLKKIIQETNNLFIILKVSAIHFKRFNGGASTSYINNKLFKK
jgi:hypothetical protein